MQKVHTYSELFWISSRRLQGWVRMALDILGQDPLRLLLNTAAERLTADPLAETRHLKTLRPNPVAQRELRLFGKYRILFNVDPAVEVVTIVLVGEKQGESLLVQGEEFSEHHESNPPK